MTKHHLQRINNMLSRLSLCRKRWQILEAKMTKLSHQANKLISKCHYHLPIINQLQEFAAANPVVANHLFSADRQFIQHLAEIKILFQDIHLHTAKIKNFTLTFNEDYQDFLVRLPIFEDHPLLYTTDEFIADSLKNIQIAEKNYADCEQRDYLKAKSMMTQADNHHIFQYGLFDSISRQVTAHTDYTKYYNHFVTLLANEFADYTQKSEARYYGRNLQRTQSILTIIDRINELTSDLKLHPQDCFDSLLKTVEDEMNETIKSHCSGFFCGLTQSTLVKTYSTILNKLPIDIINESRERNQQPGLENSPTPA